MTRVIIDLNVRVSLNGWTNITYADFDDVIGTDIPLPGEQVTAIEIETGINGDATVVKVDTEKRILFLKVDWKRLMAP